jgi:hypothetical protein
MELGYFALAERSFKLGLQYSEASDLVMQDNLMHYLMVRALPLHNFSPFLLLIRLLEAICLRSPCIEKHMPSS